MNVYKINFLYQRTDRKRPVAGNVRVLANSAGEAREAFTATHPDGSNFHYAITGTEAIAFGELF